MNITNARRWEKIKTKVIIVSIVVFIAFLIGSSYILIRDFFEYKKSNEANTELIEKVISIEGKEEKSKMQIDWQKLKSVNKDIIGWIRIDDTHINYPILKSTEKLEYMENSFNGERNKNGSIFTIDSNPFIDNVTTIYGHNMKSGLMFSDLRKYMNKSFFDAHSTFEIYTEIQNYKATIFSCYSIGQRTEKNNIEHLNFKDEIEYYKSNSVHKATEIDNINKIIKLSTCSYLNNKTTPTNQRYFIIAKLEEQ